MKKNKIKISPMVLAYAGLTLTIFFWAVNTVIAKAVVMELKPMTLSFYRWVMAFIFILPFAIPHLKKDIILIKQNLGFLFFLSIPSVAAYNSILYLGAQYTSATNISLVVATMPVMTILFSWIMSQEKPLVLQTLGIMVSIIGVMTIISNGSWQVLSTFSFNPGDLLIVLSIASWSFYSVLLKKKQINISPVSLLTMLIFFGVLCILPFYLWEFSVFNGFELKTSTIIIFVYLGIFPSILSYLCWNFGVKTAGASIASVFMYLLPVFTSIIAYLFLNESLFLYHFAGGLLILSGLIMSSFKWQR
ncbi:EamA family transporter [Desulfobacterales bacterium HSG17]|nr:EamA family transporter [Desulfobacterales bacterium HSG17]